MGYLHRRIKTRFLPPPSFGGYVFLLLACFHVYRAANFFRLAKPSPRGRWTPALGGAFLLDWVRRPRIYHWRQGRS